MKRRFAVPAAIALTAHALLFMGSGKPPVQFIPATPKDCPGDDIPKIQVSDTTPPPVDTEGSESDGGPKLEGPPEIPELPPTGIPKGAEISQIYVPVQPGHSTTIIPGLQVGPRGQDTNGNKLLSVTQLDDPPRTCFQKEPVYPRSMKGAGTTGTVWVEFAVDEAGRVHDVRVLKSTHPDFEQSTVEAVSTWRFEPGRRKGLPVRFRMSIPVVFKLAQ